MIIWLDETTNQQVGGKATNLMKLSHGFHVPKGFVITPEDKSRDGDIFAYFDRLGANKVAVRSSATKEDSQTHSWAGQFDTHLNVDKAGVIKAIKVCKASGANIRAQAYGDLSESSGGNIAVIVQVMVDARISGVAFSHHPVTNEHVAIIESVRGLGESLVSGNVTPDTYVCSDPIEKHAVSETPVMTDDEITCVRDLVVGVEKYLGYPVDIEWAIDDSGILYLLQARPITTL